MENLFKVEAPQLCYMYDRSEVLCNLESLARCAFFLVGDDQMGLRYMVEVELDSSIEEYNPEDEYWKCYDELTDFIAGYNFSVKENNLPGSLIELVVDHDKTNLLKDNNQYPIYKVVTCNGLE